MTDIIIAVTIVFVWLLGLYFLVELKKVASVDEYSKSIEDNNGKEETAK